MSAAGSRASATSARRAAADLRLQRLAEVLVRYCLATKTGDRVLIQAPVAAAPLLREAYRETLRAGAHPLVRIAWEESVEIMLREATAAQLEYVWEVDRAEIECADAWLSIAAAEDARALGRVAPERLAWRHRARAPLMSRHLERMTSGDLRWTHTIFPTRAYARDAGMSLREYEEFHFHACFLNEDDPIAAWRELHARQQAIVHFLEAHDHMRISAPGIDLSLRTAGRRWMNGSGTYNFPDGEVFTSPIESTVEGEIRFAFPVSCKGVRVHDVLLRFRGGEVVDASAGAGRDFLMAMLDSDEGARRVGEVAFGLNPHVDRVTGLTLFDEKVDGTMHLALGKSLPLTGGRNVSAIHWDMVADLRQGAVDVDGERCYERGKFLPHVAATAPHSPGFGTGNARRARSP